MFFEVEETVNDKIKLHKTNQKKKKDRRNDA